MFVSGLIILNAASFSAAIIAKIRRSTPKICQEMRKDWRKIKKGIGSHPMPFKVFC
jgi:hypothetical protein